MNDLTQKLSKHKESLNKIEIDIVISFLFIFYIFCIFIINNIPGILFSSNQNLLYAWIFFLEKGRVD